MAKSKIGAGHAQAMARLGGKEIAQALPALPDSIRVIEEPGVFGNATPQEVFNQKQGPLDDPGLGMHGDIDEPEMEMSM